MIFIYSCLCSLFFLWGPIALDIERLVWSFCEVQVSISRSTFS